MQRLILALMIFSASMLVGCGGSGHHDDGGSNLAYLIGAPHGDMADVLNEYIIMDPYDGSSTNRNILIADPNGGQIPEEYKEGIRASYKAGRIIAMEHAEPHEINDLLGVLGLNPSYATKSNAPEALFAVEQINGDNFYYVIANDDDFDISNLGPRPVASMCETSDGSDQMGAPYESSEQDAEYRSAIFNENDEYMLKTEASIADSMSEDESLITDEEIQKGRMARFMSWMNDEDDRVENLRSKKGEAREAIFKALDPANLRDIAEASSWSKDVSTLNKSFTINYTIYSCHSFNSDEDFYFIQQSAVLNPSAGWANKESGKNCTTLALQYGYMNYYSFKNYWNSNPGVGAPIRDHSPLNANNVTTITSGISYNIGGNVGFFGTSPQGGLSGGVSFSDSKTVNVQDVTINDQTGSGQTWAANWRYDFKKPENGSKYFACSELEDAPLLSRSNFSPVNQWVWVTSRNFRNSNASKSFKSEFAWETGRSDGAANAFWIQASSAKHTAYQSRTVTMDIPITLPPLIMTSTSQIDFTKLGTSKDFNLVSGVSWTASCNQSWCSVQDTSGPKTSSVGKTLHVTVDNNETDSNREAVITIKSTTTSDVIKITIFQSKF